MTAAEDARELYLGVEIGATKQQLALTDAQGTSLCLVSERVPLPDGAVNVRDWLAAHIPTLIARQSEFQGRVGAIGAGFGGVLESCTGRIRISVQVPGWQDFPLADWLRESFGLPALVANDTVAGGYAELCRGSGADARHFFYSNIGSGIGGALFLDREPYDGLGMGAAYIGHTYVPDWTAGSPGVEAKLENLCSGWSIERRLRTPGYVPGESSLAAVCRGDVGSLTCAMLGEAARGGDAFAVAEIERRHAVHIRLVDEALGTLTMSGAFEDRSTDSTLQAFCLALNLNVAREGDTYLIFRQD